MASEYLKRKYRDVKPEEKRELTPAERRRNWWHYHWYFLLGGLIAALILGRIAYDQLTRVYPDCGVALVTRFAPAQEELDALRAALEAVCPDVNGDGRVFVSVNAIQLDYPAIAENRMDPQAAASNLDKLSADFYTRRSGLFLLDDPDAFQAANQALARRDGSLPTEDMDGRELAVPWTECRTEPVTFAGLGEESLWLGLRVTFSEEDRAGMAGARALWERLTGA